MIRWPKTLAAQQRARRMYWQQEAVVFDEHTGQPLMLNPLHLDLRDWWRAYNKAKHEWDLKQKEKYEAQR